MSTTQEVARIENGRVKTTEAVHCRAVERVIRAMHERIGEELSLQDLADIAYMSPYHFNRVFRDVTGIPPCQFLYALRLARAKHLLVTTDRTVTDICFEVGYNSLGTFSTRFTGLVGLSPSQWARLFTDVPKQALGSQPNGMGLRGTSETGLVTGRVAGPESFSGAILIGLFSEPIPQGEPVACTWLNGPGTYQITAVPDGKYYVMAAAFVKENVGQTREPAADSETYVGRRPEPVRIQHGRGAGAAHVVLRPMRLTDPPILTALPLLVRRARDQKVDAIPADAD